MQFMKRIFKKTKNFRKLIASTRLTDREMSLLLALDGRRSEDELAEFLRMPEAEVSVVLDKLLDLNIIRPAEPSKKRRKPVVPAEKREDLSEVQISEMPAVTNEPAESPEIQEDSLTPATVKNVAKLVEPDHTVVEMNPPSAAKAQRNEKYDANSSLLATRDLVKMYGKRTVVDRVSLSVKQGEIVGLLGPNGAGKTTTFYMITGLISPNGGKIFLDDRDITNLAMYKRARRGIAYLPQEPSIFRKLSVEENLLAIMEAIHYPKKQRKQQCEKLLEELNITSIAKNKGFNLSGGERRRTEIARTLVNDPKFILLDEPFAGVDPIAVEDIQNIVLRLREKNIGVLITDHNVHETLSITSHAYLLFGGRILKEGDSEFLSNDPEARKLYLGDKFQLYR